MAAIVGALRAILSLESAAFQKGLTSAQKSLAQFDKKMKAIGGKLQVVGAGISIAGAGIAAAFRSQVNAADEMSKAAQKFGVPVEELSRLKYAADLSDVSLETLGQSLGRLSKGMVNSPAQFDKLGISILGADGKMRGADQVLTELADRFAAMPDGAEKTALAIQLFGRSGAEMIPLLNGGSAALAELNAEANAFGVTVSGKTGKAAEDFNDGLTRLSKGFQGLAMKVTEALLPTLQGVVDKLLDLTKWFGDLSPATQDFLAKVALITVVAGPALIALGTLVSSLGAVAAVFKTLAILAAANPIGLAISAIAAGAALIYMNWEGVKAFFTDLWSSVSTAAADAWSATKQAWSDVTTYFHDLIVVQLPAVFDAAWEAIKTKFLGWVENFRQLGRDIMKGLSEGILGSRDMTNITMGDAMGGLIGTAEDAVDSHSPSRVFQKIGHYIMQGLGLGIVEGAPAVNAAMDGVADQLGKGGLEASANSTRDAFKGVFSSIIDGSKSAQQALQDLLGSMADRFLSQAFDLIWGNLFPNANGNAFSGGRITAFAKGGIFTRPTTFGMRGGTGLMGEAGPEAIMPLTRIGGRLGVAAQGGGGMVVQVINNTGAPSREERTRGPDGREMLRVVVGEEIARGGLDKPMKGRFGAAPYPVKR